MPDVPILVREEELLELDFFCSCFGLQSSFMFALQGRRICIKAISARLALVGSMGRRCFRVVIAIILPFSFGKGINQGLEKG
jgi:hypothetical protein